MSKIMFFNQKNKNYQQGNFFHIGAGAQKKIVRTAIDQANIEQRQMVDKYLRTKTKPC